MLTVPNLWRSLILAIVVAARVGAQTPSDAEIRKILIDRIDKYENSVGMVVGVIGSGGRRIVSYGTFGVQDARPVGGDTLYEIGSITKVFTSVILAEMVERGEVALKDPVAKYLPAGVRVPQRGGKQITLYDLATHHSGLPRMPSDYSTNGPDDPYASYPEDKLYAFLSSYHLTRAIGAKFEYSNLGVALLGHALSRRAGKDYDSLVREHVLVPLGMSSTGYTLSSDLSVRLATGHTNLYWMTPAPNWNLTGFVGAGGLRSTANDMLTFLAANLGLTQTPLTRSLATMRKVRRDAGDEEIGLGWLILKERGSETVWHNGGTFGYKAFAGFDLKKQLGVIVLSNNSSGGNVNDIGRHILNPRIALNTFGTKQREPVEPAAQALMAYAGRYEFPDKSVWTVRTDGKRLLIRKSTEPEFEVFPQGNHRFFLKIADSQVTFEFDKAVPERANELVLRQAWLNPVRANRLE